MRARFWVGAATLLLAGGVAAWLLRAGPRGEPGPTAGDVLRFHSRPRLDPDRVSVVVPAHRTAPGYVFVAVKRGPGQDGPMIVDDRGHVVWFRPAPAGMAATGFRVQRYRGRPVLTWWQGRTRFGHGMGVYVILDRRYREVARVRAGNGYEADLHAFRLTPQGTAYFSVYAPRAMDLTAVGGARDGAILDSIVQEVDVARGRVLWEWHSADHVPVTEGVTSPRRGRPHDYFHVNAIDVDRDGNLLISARNTHAIYKVSRRTGAIIWRLGGKHSDFAFGAGARFAFQHDVHRRPDGTISLFDNEATPAQAQQSRGLVLRLDMRRRTARVVRAYTHPDKLLAGAEGNVQTLRNGDVFVGWGPQEHVSELSRGGRLLFDLRLPPGSDTYQAFRSPWQGEPLDRPALAARRAGGRVTAWASWNGATELRGWELLAGDDPADLRPVATAPRRDFETALTARTGARWVAVRALGADGRPLALSQPTAVGD
ncbi:MAG TPA: arylsulfotransferase family protein [Conexibacter sp.]|nr:arylsulfotransferase family protein [Conexibacter sp.]